MCRFPFRWYPPTDNQCWIDRYPNSSPLCLLKWCASKRKKKKLCITRQTASIWPSRYRITLITEISASISRLYAIQALIIFQTKWGFVSFGHPMPRAVVDVECRKHFHAVIMSTQKRKTKRESTKWRRNCSSTQFMLWPLMSCWFASFAFLIDVEIGGEKNASVLTGGTDAIPTDALECLDENRPCPHSMCVRWISANDVFPCANHLNRVEFHTLALPSSSPPSHTAAKTSVDLPNVHFASAQHDQIPDRQSVRCKRQLPPLIDHPDKSPCRMHGVDNLRWNFRCRSTRCHLSGFSTVFHCWICLFAMRYARIPNPAICTPHSLPTATIHHHRFRPNGPSSLPYWNESKLRQRRKNNNESGIAVEHTHMHARSTTPPVNTQIQLVNSMGNCINLPQLCPHICFGHRLNAIPHHTFCWGNVCAPFYAVACHCCPAAHSLEW